MKRMFYLKEVPPGRDHLKVGDGFEIDDDAVLPKEARDMLAPEKSVERKSDETTVIVMSDPEGRRLPEAIPLKYLHLV